MGSGADEKFGKQKRNDHRCVQYAKKKKQKQQQMNT